MVVPKKYEMLGEDKIESNDGKSTVYRIRALRDFGVVKKGDLGGYIQYEHNLDHDGDCWVFGDAIVCECARVQDNAMVGWFAKVAGHAKICDNAVVSGESVVFDDATVRDYAAIFGDRECGVGDYSIVEGRAHVFGSAKLSEHALVTDDARICFDGVIGGHSVVDKHAEIEEDCDAYIVRDVVKILSRRFSSRDNTFMVFNTKQGEFRITCGNFGGSLEDFRYEIGSQFQRGSRPYEAYNALLQMLEHKLNIGKEED